MMVSGLTWPCGPECLSTAHCHAWVCFSELLISLSQVKLHTEAQRPLACLS